MVDRINELFLEGDTLFEGGQLVDGIQFGEAFLFG